LPHGCRGGLQGLRPEDWRRLSNEAMRLNDRDGAVTTDSVNPGAAIPIAVNSGAVHSEGRQKTKG